MKKHRLIKITVKTRETVSLSKNAAPETASESSNPLCPVCHTPLFAVLPAAGNSAAAAPLEKPTAELPPAKFADREEEEEQLEIKGDL